MKLDKKINKLLSEHELREIMDQIISQAGLPKVLLQISNRLCYKGGGKDKMAKVWLKRAKLIHGIMEEIETEEQPSKLEA